MLRAWCCSAGGVSYKSLLPPSSPNYTEMTCAAISLFRQFSQEVPSSKSVIVPTDRSHAFIGHQSCAGLAELDVLGFGVAARGN